MTDVISRIRWQQILLIPIGLTLLWPAYINGSPFLFPDTTSYIRSVDAQALWIFGHSTAWSSDEVRAIAAPTESAGGTSSTESQLASVSPKETKPVLLGRSVFYGVLAYAGAAAGSLWLTVFLQALFVSATIFALTRHFVDPSNGRRFAKAFVIAIGVLLTTPIAFFTSMTMPDVFAGTTIIAAAALIAGWGRETFWGRITWMLIATYGALVHSSYVLILAAVATLALLCSLRLPSINRTGAVLAMIAACTGVAGEALFSASVLAATGTPPIRPPFITARLADDGPGTKYLSENCDRPQFLLCKYRHRLPLSSDEFLWRTDDKGIFKAISVPEQRQLAAEQNRFAWAVVKSRPFDVVLSTAGAIKRQALAWKLSEFDQSSQDARAISDKLPPADRAAFIQSAAYRGAVPTGLTSTMVFLWFLLGFAMLVAILRFPNLPGVRAEVSLLVIGWMINLSVCGALSTPHDRYQARTVWIFAVVTLIGLVNHQARRRATHA